MLLVFAERVGWVTSGRPCPGDLPDAQRKELAPLLLVPPDETKGHPRTVDFRDVVNDILYVLREARAGPRCSTTCRPGARSGGTLASDESAT